MTNITHAGSVFSPQALWHFKWHFIPDKWMKSTRKKTIFLVLLAIIFCTVLPVHAADYAALKTTYIANHPGQSIIPFPWEPTSSIKVLPFNYNIPAGPDNNLSIVACRNEFEPASFIISSQKALSGITVTVPTLY